jgi:hypothetical protein
MSEPFLGYFVATEGAFVEEKAAMLDRIHQLHGSWEEAADLDAKAAKMCEELQSLKSILSRAHLQILRTREEMLRLDLQNAQHAFRIRQIQSEIWRFLSHTTTTVSTVDYELTVSRIDSGPAQISFVDPDEKFAKKIIEIQHRWEVILLNQDAVFEEEMQHRLADNAYFEKFLADFNQQNADAHQTINDTLKRVIRRIIRERESMEGASHDYQERINQMTQKRQKLADQSKEFQESATKRSLEERAKIQQKVALESRVIRGRVKTLEQSNLRKFGMLQERNAEYHRQHRDILDRVHELRKQEAGLMGMRIDDRLLKRLFDLEARMNALISAAAAVKEQPAETHENLLRMISSAIGDQGKVTESAEVVGTQLRNLTARAGRVSRKGA